MKGCHVCFIFQSNRDLVAHRIWEGPACTSYKPVSITARLSQDPNVRSALIPPGWWFGTSFMTFLILGMSSSQLTLTPSFFRGVGLYHQPATFLEAFADQFPTGPQVSMISHGISTRRPRFGSLVFTSCERCISWL